MPQLQKSTAMRSRPKGSRAGERAVETQRRLKIEDSFPRHSLLAILHFSLLSRPRDTEVRGGTERTLFHDQADELPGVDLLHDLLTPDEALHFRIR